MASRMEPLQLRLGGNPGPAAPGGMATGLGSALALAAHAAGAVPRSIVRRLAAEPFRTRPTAPEETYWIVPEISFGTDAAGEPR